MLRVLSWHVLAVHDVNLWGEAEDVLSASDAWNSRASAKRLNALPAWRRVSGLTALPVSEAKTRRLVAWLCTSGGGRRG